MVELSFELKVRLGLDNDPLESFLQGLHTRLRLLTVLSDALVLPLAPQALLFSFIHLKTFKHETIQLNIYSHLFMHPSWVWDLNIFLTALKVSVLFDLKKTVQLFYLLLVLRESSGNIKLVKWTTEFIVILDESICPMHTCKSKYNVWMLLMFVLFLSIFFIMHYYIIYYRLFISKSRHETEVARFFFSISCRISEWTSKIK